MIIEQTQYELLPVGEYPAVIVEATPDEGQFGPQIKFVFNVAGGQYDGCVLSAWTSQKFSSKSKLYQWTRAAFGRDIPKTYNLDTDELLGRHVNLVVTIQQKDDGTEFNKVETLRPAGHANGQAVQQASTPTPPPSPPDDDWFPPAEQEDIPF